MLIVVSPAKALDFESPLPTRRFTVPEMLDRTEELVGIMRQNSPEDLSRMMAISPKLGELNFERFQDWTVPFTPRNARPAVLAFNGDTYQGLAAGRQFDARDFTRAQKMLRILSGLHGVLRPLDLIQPYRLEMGSKVRHGNGGDLYSFWGSTVTERLRADMETSPGPRVLVNLASKEYFGVVKPEVLDAPVVSPVFLDAGGDSGDGGEGGDGGDGALKVVSFFAKRARGAMAGWIVRERINSVRALRQFDLDGYRFDPDRSAAHQPVFTRPARPHAQPDLT
ncbi:MAG: peroxide stress protein YaaA [Acidimicrobiales bacterium]